MAPQTPPAFVASRRSRDAPRSSRQDSSTLATPRRACDRRRMLAYTRRQIVLLFVVVAVGAAGIGIDRWRRGNPDVVAYLESLDRTAGPTMTAREPMVRRPPARTSAPQPA